MALKKTKINRQIVVIVGCLIKNGKILMTQRDEEECPDAHLKWELPGGKIEFGETPEESLAREFLEETGIKVQVKKLIPHLQIVYWDYAWGKQQTLVIGYVCQYIKGVARTRDHHVKNISWVDLKKVSTLITLPAAKELIQLASKL